MPRLRRRQDLVDARVAAGHVRVAHARLRREAKRLPPPAAGRFDAHQARVEPVLHVAAQHAVFDEHLVLAGNALVVDVEAAALFAQVAVVVDRDQFARDAFADAPAVERRAAPVEIAFEPVADGLVQQHAAAARSDDHLHLAGRRRDAAEVDRRDARRLGRERLGRLAIEVRDRRSAAVADVARAALLLVARHDLHAERHERPAVVRRTARRSSRSRPLAPRR